MIPPESKAKLEEIRAKQHKELPEHLALTWEYNAAWMEGAKAAWQMATELAVKAERERCAQVVFDAKPGETNRDVMKAILNPPKDGAEK